MTDADFIKLLTEIANYYNIAVSHHSIEQTILTHPDYPSMRCISDAFDSWKIKHVVAMLSLDKLRALDVPVIAHLKTGEFVWVTLITDTKVHYRSGVQAKEKLIFTTALSGNGPERRWQSKTLTKPESRITEKSETGKSGKIYSGMPLQEVVWLC